MKYVIYHTDGVYLAVDKPFSQNKWDTDLNKAIVYTKAAAEKVTKFAKKDRIFVIPYDEALIKDIIE